MAQPMPALFLGLALLAAGPTDIGPPAALAQSCYAVAQVRAMVANKEIKRLSNFLGQIRAVTGGGTPSESRLCNVGGRRVYMVVIIVGGEPREVTVDAVSGAVY